MNELRMDYSNLLSEQIGEEGVTLEEWERNKERAQRLWWSLQEKRSRGDLPFLDLPYMDFGEQVQKVSQEIKGGFDPLILLGIGGSCLGTRAILEALFPPFFQIDGRVGEKGPRVFLLDNIDPSIIAYVLERAKEGDPLVVVVSKSGRTAETLSQFIFFLRLLKERWPSSWKERLLIVTDPDKGPLRRFAKEEGVVALPFPRGVEGRFSVLSPVGLLPAALLGVKIEQLLLGAVEMDRAMKQEGEENPVLFSAYLHYLLHITKGKGQWITMPYSDALGGVAAWRRQLVAESLGKRKDLAPTPSSAVGTTDQHSQLQLWLDGPRDKIVAFLTIEDRKNDPIIPPSEWQQEEVEHLQGKGIGSLLDAERRSTEYSLTIAGCPNYTITLRPGPKALGMLFYFWEVEVTLLGYLYGVDPFGQPAVEEGKRVAAALMGKKGLEGKGKEWEKWRKRRREWLWPK